MRNLKPVTRIVVLIAVLAAVVIPAAAQDSAPGYPLDTITVTGYGTAQGAPDRATVEVGVEVMNPDVSEAFRQANQMVDDVISALVEAGVTREDIRTTNLNIHRRSNFDPQSGAEEMSYVVSNTVRIVIRDIEAVEEVINAAVEAGANQIYGLHFDISDTTALESEARAEAMDHARARAQELASLIGATLGDVLVVSEGGAPGFPMASFERMNAGGGGGVVIEPGVSTVQVALQVTYRINR